MVPGTSSLFGRVVSVGTEQDLRDRLITQLVAGRKSLYFCNVHMLMLSQEDQVLAHAMESTDLILPDGVPVAWLQRRLGHPDAVFFRGETALEVVCERAASSDQPIGFYGSTSKVLDALVRNLRDRHPELRIEFAHPPPWMTGEIQVDPVLVEEINSHNLFCLFVGLGCPKQEKWVAAYSPYLNCNVLAVGAVLDWVAGAVPQPPPWIVKIGLAWLFRLLQNPKRMWYRYLKYNTKFIYMTARLLFYERWSSRSGRRQLQ
jgi:N-acetylglucosaminyldiphosphoundecaprenol N-acetyl-beta-D-mannosaminyltransferase